MNTDALGLRGIHLQEGGARSNQQVGLRPERLHPPKQRKGRFLTGLQDHLALPRDPEVHDVRIPEQGHGWSTACFSGRKTLLRVGSFDCDFVSTISFLDFVIESVFLHKDGSNFMQHYIK